MRYMLGRDGSPVLVDEAVVLDQTAAERQRILIALEQLGGRFMDEYTDVKYATFAEVLAIVYGADGYEARWAGKEK